MPQKKIDFEEFDKMWTNLGKEICRVLYTKPQIQKLKNSLQKRGSLTPAENSEFINLCNATKYEVIYSKYGKDGSPGYKDFSQDWQAWFQQKGVESQKGRAQKSSVDHILFGSTPDPAIFLLHFEEEMLGSMKDESNL